MPTGPQPPKKNNLPLLLGLGVGALILVVGAIVAGVLVMNRDGSDVASTTDPTTTSTRPTTSPQTPTPTSTGLLDSQIPGSFWLDQHIAMGTCYDLVSTTFDLSDTRVVDCSVPHAMEFVSTFWLTQPYVDQDDPRVLADGMACWRDVIVPQLNADPNLLADSNVGTWYPSGTQIAKGEMTAYCVLVGTDSQLLVGSLVAGTYQGAK